MIGHAAGRCYMIGYAAGRRHVIGHTTGGRHVIGQAALPARRGVHAAGHVHVRAVDAIADAVIGVRSVAVVAV